MTNNDDVLISANDYAATDDVLVARYLRWNPITHCDSRAILR